VRLDDASQLAAGLASPTPEPAAGIALCTTGAMAAALVAKACALSPDAGLQAEHARANDLRAELLATAERDVAAFHAVLESRRSGGDEREAWAVAALVLRDAAALLEETRFLAEDVAARCRPALRGEPLAAALLAVGAERGALALAEIDEAV
jgi:formiminotetrahydrofolate cyclodeaminase